jgi:hypothetical protein
MYVGCVSPADRLELPRSKIVDSAEAQGWHFCRRTGSKKDQNVS